VIVWDLQHVGARFSNFLLGKLSREFKLRSMSTFHEIQMAYFGSAWGYSQMLRHADNPTGIVHADMTLTRSKVKVEVTELLNFWKLAKLCMLAAMTVSPIAGLSIVEFWSPCPCPISRSICIPKYLASSIQKVWWRPHNFIMSHMTLTTLILGYLISPRLLLDMAYLSTKFDGWLRPLQRNEANAKHYKRHDLGR